jgi:hypothetical protein
MYNLTVSDGSFFIDSIKTSLWKKYLLAIMAMVVIQPMGKTSDEITGKVGNEMRQVRTYTWAPLPLA